MSGDLSVDTGLLQASATSFGDLGRRVRDITTNLTTVIGEVGACWGDDTTGKQFEAQYKPPADQTAEGVTGLGQVLSGTGDGLTVTAKAFTVTEDGNTRAARGAAGLG